MGSVTLRLLRRQPTLRVLAVEPSSDVFRYLLWNLRANGMAHRCVALNVALAAEGGLGTLHEYSPMPERSNIVGVSSADAVSWHGSSIRLLNFVQLLREARVPVPLLRFLKVDCEGCEWSLPRAAPVGLWNRIDTRRVLLSAELHMPHEELYAGKPTAVLLRLFCGIASRRPDGSRGNWLPSGNWRLVGVCMRNVRNSMRESFVPGRRALRDFHADRTSSVAARQQVVTRAILDGL
eukprot:TRINITY_DN33724_c0_g1_i1.p1 TRINITY_DN33724_c0_g1~~TRINITY_DN33724_c0_g1_i1.p1  ORF type:complete len:258 (+),score=22.18 TRINITY_DN33724_c0_g1_i1:67-774(+)